MAFSADEVLRYVTERENDVKFVRLAFCDLYGMPKNISVPPGMLKKALSEGVSFDPAEIPGFGKACETAFLRPDPSTLAVLPWRPQHGRVVRFYCDIKQRDGTPAPFDTRASLKLAVTAAEQAGYKFSVLSECDFYLFLTGEQGEPLYTPFDKGGYLDVYPSDLGENVRREICFHLEEMSIKTTASHHARGEGQNTIALGAADALTSADNLLTFRMTVGTAAGQNGLWASFNRAPADGLPSNILKLSVFSDKSGEISKQFDPSVNPYIVIEEMIRGVL